MNYNVIKTCICFFFLSVFVSCSQYDKDIILLLNIGAINV